MMNKSLMNLLDYKDIFIQICSYVKINVLIRSSVLSVNHKKIVRSYPWMNFEIVIKDIRYLDHIGSNYNFKKYDFNHNIQITDKTICKLKNCHTLNLAFTSIT